jgi:hypothetical protein
MSASTLGPTPPVTAFGDLSGPGMGAHGRIIAAGWTGPAWPAVVEALVNEDMGHRSRCGDPDCDHIWSARLAASSANRCDDLGWWTLTRRPGDFARGAGGLLVAVCRDDAARRCWWEAYVDARHGGAAHGLEGLASVPSEEIT